MRLSVVVIACLLTPACGGRSQRIIDERSRDPSGDAGASVPPTPPDPPDDPVDPPPDASPPEDSDAGPRLRPEPILAAAGSTDYGWTCGLSTSGRVTCWGGTHGGREYAAPPEERYVDIALTATNGCGILESGQARCWGYDPVPAEQPGPFTRFINKATGLGGRFCAIGANPGQPSATCWGGGGTNIWAADLRAYSQGSATCSVYQDGTLSCVRFDSSPLVLPFPAREWTDVMVGSGPLCALAATGEAWCVRDLNADPMEIIASTTEVRTLAMGFVQACALKWDRSLECWPITRFVDVGGPPEGEYDAVAVGFYFGCVARTDGSVVCWGRNDYGQGAPPADLLLK